MDARQLAPRIARSLRRRFREGVFEAYVRWMGVAGARGVTSPARFALRELFLRKEVGQYTLRRSRQTMFIRHPMSDALVVYEVINGASYVPPPDVHAMLSALPAPRIVDLGAHVGSSTLLFLEHFPSAQVTLFEPQPDTAAVLRKTITANGLDPQCEVRQAAAGVAPGVATIEGSSFLAHVSRDDDTVQEAVDLMPPLAKYQDASPPIEITVDDVFPALEGADLVKMDIEGAEWPILQDPRFATLGIRALVLEYHPQGAPRSDTRAAVTEILQGLGFTVSPPVVDHGANGVVWAWRP